MAGALHKGALALHIYASTAASQVPQCINGPGLLRSGALTLRVHAGMELEALGTEEPRGGIRKRPSSVQSRGLTNVIKILKIPVSLR